jgi:isoleucyl-tRNA synthetase
VLGKRLGKAMGKVAKAVKQMPQDDLLLFQKTGTCVIDSYTLSQDDITIKYEFLTPAGFKRSDVDAASGEEDVMVIVDLTIDQQLLDSGTARELVNRIQKLRKSAGLHASDEVWVFFEPKLLTDRTSNDDLHRLLKAEESYLKSMLGREPRHVSSKPSYAVTLASDWCTLSTGAEIKVTLTRPCVSIIKTALQMACNDSEELAAAVSSVMLSREYISVACDCRENDGFLSIHVDGKVVSLQAGKEFILE